MSSTDYGCLFSFDENEEESVKLWRELKDEEADNEGDWSSDSGDRARSMMRGRAVITSYVLAK